MQISEHASQSAGKSFDSLAYAKRMESVGFTRQQAETLAEEQAKLIDERLATKEDIAALRLATKQDIAALRDNMKNDLGALDAKLGAQSVALDAKLGAQLAELDAKLGSRIAESKNDMIKWVVGIGFAQAAMIIGVLKLHV